MTGIRKIPLPSNWCLVRLLWCSSGLGLGGKTPNIFLLTGISNRNIFFIQNMKNVVVYSNIHEKCSAGETLAKTWKLCYRHVRGEPSLSLVLCPPHTEPIQQQHEFPRKPALNTCRSRCQQVSTLLPVLLKAEGDVEDGEVILMCA